MIELELLEIGEGAPQDLTLAKAKSVPVCECNKSIDPCRASVLEDGTVVFHVIGYEVMRFCANGDILVHGRKADNDKEVVDKMRAFVRGPRALFGESKP